MAKSPLQAVSLPVPAGHLAVGGGAPRRVSRANGPVWAGSLEICRIPREGEHAERKRALRQQIQPALTAFNKEGRTTHQQQTRPHQLRGTSPLQTARERLAGIASSLATLPWSAPSCSLCVSLGGSPWVDGQTQPRTEFPQRYPCLRKIEPDPDACYPADGGVGMGRTGVGVAMSTIPLVVLVCCVMSARRTSANTGGGRGRICILSPTGGGVKSVTTFHGAPFFFLLLPRNCFGIHAHNQAHTHTFPVLH